MIEINFENLSTCLTDMKDILGRNRYQVPEEFYRSMFDLLYHSSKALRELEVDYVKFVKAWDSCMCELRRLSR